MNEEILDTEKDAEQSILSDKEVQVQTSEPITESLVVVEHYEKVERKLDNLTVISIALAVGIGLLFGSLVCKSLFDFLR